ncbi:MAG TPA: hypothetical protein VF203_05310 [Burkholderiales bacterium]
MATAVVHETAVRARSLRSFYVGAAIDLLLGIDLLLFSPALAALLLPGQAEVLGVASGTLLRAFGVLLIVFALDTVWLARTQNLRRYLPLVIAANWAWVAGSAVAIVAGYSVLSTAGIVAIAAVALITAELAIFQRRAL